MNMKDQTRIAKEIVGGFYDAIRKAAGGRTDEESDTVDLHLSREEFMAKMLEEKDGQRLLDLLEDGEWRVVERMGLCQSVEKEGYYWFDVPRWNNLVSYLRGEA